MCTYTPALRYEEFNGTVYDNVRLCSRDQNSKWPPLSPTIANIQHNLIAICYINMILFCPSLCFTFQDVKRSISTDARQENRVIFKMSEVASLRLGSKSVVMERYTGPNKVNPPLVVCRSGPPFTDVCALQGSLECAQDRGHSMAELPPA